MRTALATRPNPRARGGQGLGWKAGEGFMPAPTQGYDTDSPVAELPLTLARRMENWIPKGVSLEIRKGYDEHVSGIEDTVETLMGYVAGSTSQLFAAADDSIYNVTSAGAVGAAVVGSLTSARFSHTNITTSGGSFLFACNGADAPLTWNGSAWDTPSLTHASISASSLSYVFAFKERLLFVVKDTLTFCYLAVQAIAGSLSDFPLGAVFNYGGSLVAIGSISRDGGAGIDDFAVFLTSEGEIAVYQGTNHGEADEWALVGVYYVGEPVGDRPLVDLGDDLGVITLNGLESVKAIMANSSQKAPPLTTRIGGDWQGATAVGRALSGWEGIWVPSEDLLLVNAPANSTKASQFVRHRVTGGWTRFSGWDFACFEFFQGKLYAGGIGGNVYECFNGYDDDGEDIAAALETAWSTLGNPQLKTLLEVRTVVSTVTRASYRIVGRADFKDSPALPGWPVSTLTNALIWGSGVWGVNVWGGVDHTTRQWRAISGEGFNVSLVLEARANQSRFALNGWQLRYVIGGQV